MSTHNLNRQDVWLFVDHFLFFAIHISCCLFKGVRNTIIMIHFNIQCTVSAQSKTKRTSLYPVTLNSCFDLDVNFVIVIM